MISSNHIKSNLVYENRKQIVLCILFAIFLGTLAILNIIGITRFVDLSFNILGTKIPLVIAVGTLPYPITFLCTDLVSELYGKQKANLLVWCGFIVNLWTLCVLWIGGILPGFEEISSEGQILQDAAGRFPIFFEIQKLTFGTTCASMCAYFSAQFCDVYIFHFLKKRTKGKHLWLRNNVSTLCSQLVDSVAVIFITHFYAKSLPLKESEGVEYQIMCFIFSSYLFKVLAALLDTFPLYFLVYKLKIYLNIEEHS